MGIFEYQCEKCGYIFEQINLNNIIKISVTCPNCKGLGKRIMSSSNFIIKGYSNKNGYSKEK